MMTPKLQKHVGNFSCLSGEQGCLLTSSQSPQHFMQTDLEVLLCPWTFSVSESDLEIVHYSSCHLGRRLICISHFKFNLPRLWSRWRFIQICYMFSLKLSKLLGVESLLCQVKRKLWKETKEEWVSKTEQEPELVRRVGLQCNQH